MMADYIKREDVIDAIHTYWGVRLAALPTRITEDGEEFSDMACVNEYLTHNKVLNSVIKELPSADVVERPLYERALSDVVRLSVDRKKWKWIKEGYIENTWIVCICPVCGKNTLDPGRFCTNCGAEMETAGGGT